MRFCLASILLLSILAGGCSKSGETLPKMSPVKGTILHNGSPAGAGFVRFMPVEYSDLIVNGEVASNGTFELQTVVNKDKRVKGAPAGNYTVTYNFNAKDQQSAWSTTTKKVYTIEDKSNELTVELVE
jgi:hypothetical protein